MNIQFFAMMVIAFGIVLASVMVLGLFNAMVMLLGFVFGMVILAMMDII